MKFDKSGKPTFIDEKDRALYRGLLSQILNKYGSNAIFEMEIRLHESKDITINQINLFNVLISLIRDYTGQDFNDIKNTLIQKYFGNHIEIDSISKKEFSLFFEFSINFCQEFFNLNVTYNEKTSKLEIMN